MNLSGVLRDAMAQSSFSLSHTSPEQAITTTNLHPTVLPQEAAGDTLLGERKAPAVPPWAGPLALDGRAHHPAV